MQGARERKRVLCLPCIEGRESAMTVDLRGVRSGRGGHAGVGSAVAVGADANL